MKRAGWRKPAVTLVVLAAVAGVVVATRSGSPSPEVASANVKVYKTVGCGCCSGWVEHMRDKGFTVEAKDVSAITQIKRRLGVPPTLESCHTAVVGDYVIEGHVPADVIERLLKEHPNIAGLAVPGMPVGTPGMEGGRKDHYKIIAFDADGNQSVYDSR
ncbi:MAG: DUF411 domain-containing protein [Gemmatimonadota bacterium]